MDTALYHPTAPPTLITPLLAFRDNHPFLTALILITYTVGLLTYSAILCAGLQDLHGPGGIPWLPPIFLTDGILVCCCPLAAVLPVVLWPLLIASNVLLACLRWFLAAPTFCGIRREALIRPFRACTVRVRRWVRERRNGGKQRRALLPVVGDGLRSAPRGGYGTVNEGGSRANREYYASPRPQRMHYARQPPFQSDVASVRSVPPPYQE